MTGFVLQTVKYDCIFFTCAWFYLLTSSIFRDVVKKFSSTQRRSLNEKLKPLFCVSLQSHMPAPPHCHLAGLKFQYRACATVPGWPETQQTCPASQLWQYLRRFYHANVTKRPLVQNWILFGHWRAGKRDTWLPAPVNVNVSLDYLLFVGQRRVGERQTLTDKSYRLGGDSALTKLKEQVLQCLATETKTR